MAGNRTAIWVMMALWAGAMVMSGLALTAEPTGDGFTRGLNRVTGFIGWQAPGMILALAVWLSSRPLERGDRLRWLARLPGWWTALLIVGVAVLIVVSAWIANRPPPISDAPPTAAPVTARGD
jgi:uncharacterized membrane protein YhiD involved in acid resistance